MDAYNELTYIVNSFRLPNESTESLIARVITDYNLMQACASVCPTLNCNIEMVKMILVTPYFKHALDQ